MKRIGFLLLAAYGALGIFSGFEVALAENHWKPIAVAWVVMGVVCLLVTAFFWRRSATPPV
jgi:hypothetical protein